MKSFGMPAVWKKHFPFFQSHRFVRVCCFHCVFTRIVCGGSVLLLCWLESVQFYFWLICIKRVSIGKKITRIERRKSKKKLLGIVLSACLIMVTFIPVQIKAENTADNILIEHGVPLEIINKMTELQKEYLRDNLTVYFQWIW